MECKLIKKRLAEVKKNFTLNLKRWNSDIYGKPPNWMNRGVKSCDMILDHIDSQAREIKFLRKELKEYYDLKKRNKENLKHAMKLDHIT